MKVNIYAKQFEPTYTDTLVWTGDLDCIPRLEEQVFVFEGWGGATVRGVYWDLEQKFVEIWFEDHTGEYSKHAKELKIGE